MRQFFRFENFRIAFRYIIANWVRSMLTIFVIVFGIMALVGMITALNGIKSSLLKNFASLGANSFSIERSNIFTERHGREDYSDPVSYREAMMFREKYTYPSTVSINFTPTGIAIIKYESKKTNPRIRVTGGDENYLFSSNLKISEGRNFTQIEDQFGALVAIIGDALRHDLFGDENPVGKYISLGQKKFRVIGVIEKQGSMFGFSPDNFVVIPVIAARRSYPEANSSFNITVTVRQIEELDAATQEAIAMFRNARKLKPYEDNNFFIRKSESLLNIISSQFNVITVITLVISLFTLLGSAVGLMNIMLVSVKERIREIGTLKALGATVNDIKYQFLAEALLISQIGGLFGILIGLLVGNFVASKLGCSFVIPWIWLIIAFMTSLVVGVAAGYYPAVRAARLNPIEALRYE